MTPAIIAADPGWPYSKAKTAVLSAAAAVIREEGPRAATLKNIANRAGITEPAIFRHFDGVDGLFNGLFHAFERTYQRFDELYAIDARGADRLRAAALAIVDYLAASKDFAYILIHAHQVFRGYPDFRKRIADYAKRDLQNALACIAEGVKSGEIRGDVDPASIAAASSGVIYTAVNVWIDSGFSFDLRKVCDKRWDDFEKMILAKPLRAKSGKPRERPVIDALKPASSKLIPEFKAEPAKHRAPRAAVAKAKAPAKAAKKVVKAAPKAAAKSAPKAKAAVKAKPQAKAAPKAVAKAKLATKAKAPAAKARPSKSAK